MPTTTTKAPDPVARKCAADARMIAGWVGVNDAAQTQRIREVVSRNYALGLAAGRQAERDENADVNPRPALLVSGAGMLDSLREQTEKIPGSDLAVNALREAEAILRDAAVETVPPVPRLSRGRRSK